MTQEQKELLLKDLCARLPYKVHCEYILDEDEEEIIPDAILINIESNVDSIGGFCQFRGLAEDIFINIENVKPYLRPMSSMTEEEESEICQFMKEYNLLPGPNKAALFCSKITDWLVAHHFDYRGLIPMDLAIEASKGMY